MSVPPQSGRSVRGLVALGALLALALPVGAQSARRAPTTYALTNARIVPGVGPTIEKGTIVIRDGVIAAVGATIAAPADARVIDGSGLTVYPGFIDAYGTLGVPAGAAPQATGGRGGGGGAAFAAAGGPNAGGGRQGAANSSMPVGLQPEVNVVDLLSSNADALSGAQSAGFTSALTAQGSGIFQGSSALINLAGGDVQAMVVKNGIAQHIAFTPLRGTFPNSLMGVFAALRQTLLDAQHYRDVQAAYAKNPRGMARPEFDASLDALQDAIGGRQPVVMLANSQREIERALDLAKEFDLKPIIAGGLESYKVAARLKAENVPVLLSLNFPRRAGPVSADADPDPIRVLQERAQAPKTAAELAKAGVTFAFESGGMNTWTDVAANVKRAVDNGLATDAALKALTSTPAAIFGVGDRIGSIETGKIANLTISRGDWFTGGRVTQLFIDGKPVTIPAPVAATDAAGGRGGFGGRGGAPGGASGGAPGAGGDAEAFTASGTWTLSVNIDAVDRSVTLSLRQEGTRLVGSFQGMLGAAEIQNGSIDADRSFRFTAPVTIKDGTEEATFIGSFDGNAVRGRVTIVSHAPGLFSGTRPARDGARPPR